MIFQIYIENLPVKNVKDNVLDEHLHQKLSVLSTNLTTPSNKRLMLQKN